jgi:hypothetical protein
MSRKPAKRRWLECPRCGGPMSVKRTDPRGPMRFRRLECSRCGRFTTVEKFVTLGGDALPVEVNHPFGPDSDC